jgi:phospholipid transport system substrate-binding protein
MLCVGLLTVLCEEGFSMSALARAPTEALQRTHIAVLRVLQDTELSAPLRAVERQSALSHIIGPRFNSGEMARHILGEHWQSLRDDERAKFTRLFHLLFLKTYLGPIARYAQHDMQYLGEWTQHDHAMVRAKLQSPHRELILEFWLTAQAGDWQVYDVAVDGMRLIQNYRVQFHRLLRFSPYTTVVSRLRERACGVDGDYWTRQADAVPAQ